MVLRGVITARHCPSPPFHLLAASNVRVPNDALDPGNDSSYSRQMFEIGVNKQPEFACHGLLATQPSEPGFAIADATRQERTPQGGTHGMYGKV
jgi:hypothetical protein